MKILVVDDNPKMRKMIIEILSTRDKQFFEHNDGAGIVEVYSSINPDWVVMDVKMISVDGIEATKNIISHYPKARIVVASHFSDEETQKLALSAGAQKFISKENLTELIEVIN